MATVAPTDTNAVLAEHDITLFYVETSEDDGPYVLVRAFHFRGLWNAEMGVAMLTWHVKLSSLVGHTRYLDKRDEHGRSGPMTCADSFYASRALTDGILAMKDEEMHIRNGTESEDVARKVAHEMRMKEATA